jgi:hypothetical protein
MARIFIDGFETGNLDLWDDVNAASSIVITGTPGNYYVGNFWTNYCNMYKWLTPIPYIYMAFRVYPNNTSYARDILQFNDPTGVQMTLSRNTSNGYLEFYSGSRASLKATGTHAVNHSGWHLVELYYLPHATSGVFQTKVDGVADIDFSGITSPRTANVGNVMFGTWLAPSYWSGYFDDIIIDDAEWIGDTRVVPLLITGDDASPQWIPSTGATQYGVIDEVPPSLTDYLYTQSVDQITTLKNGKLSGMFSAIKCIQPYIQIGKQNNPIPTKVDLGLYIDGDVSSPRYGASLPAPIDFKGYSLVDVTQRGGLYNLPTNPATGLPWTRNEIDALKFVIKSKA